MDACSERKQDPCAALFHTGMIRRWDGLKLNVRNSFKRDSRWSVNTLVAQVRYVKSKEWRLETREDSSVPHIWQVEQRQFLCLKPSNGNLKWGSEWHGETLKHRKRWGGGGFILVSHPLSNPEDWQRFVVSIHRFHYYHTRSVMSQEAK